MQIEVNLMGGDTQPVLEFLVFTEAAVMSARNHST
jgi:hypothetical protein